MSDGNGPLSGLARKLPGLSSLLDAGAPGPLPVRMLNAAGHRLGNSWIGLDPDDMVARAERSTRLSDWGEDKFRDALDRLLESARSEARLNAMGRLMIRNYVGRILENRLKVERDLKAYPSILSEEIRRPVFIVGLPRTGSTLLQRLLARDPAVRSLQTWETMYPSPPPEPSTYDCDPRIPLTDKRLKMLDWLAPGFAAAHELVAGEPEECVGLLQTSLKSYCFDLFGDFASYRSWLDEDDQRATYAYYRKLLQLLQWGYPKDHWVLKSPFHLWGLDALLETFPDAIIVQTHREPVQVTPSLCSLLSVTHRLCSDSAQPEAMGPIWLERLAAAMETVMNARERVGEDRFVDISYRRLAASPVKVASELNDRFGFALSSTAVTAMRAWLGSNQQHKRGVHHYTLESFGLDARRVNQAFARYRKRFADYL
ncbi:MAG: sulfotransferase [Pseudomonadota bacterium]|nr:sulfotransferase [Pseudomonadota bacterium]